MLGQRLPGMDLGVGHQAADLTLHNAPRVVSMSAARGMDPTKHAMLRTTRKSPIQVHTMSADQRRAHRNGLD